MLSNWQFAEDIPNSGCQSEFKPLSNFLLSGRSLDTPKQRVCLISSIWASLSGILYKLVLLEVGRDWLVHYTKTLVIYDLTLLLTPNVDI